MALCVGLVVVLLPGLLKGQPPQCRDCESYHEDRVPPPSLNEIEGGCRYPCSCLGLPECGPGVSVVRDGCGCCLVCARQAGELCDSSTLCDQSKGLICQYDFANNPTGYCKEIKGLPCTVFNQTYDNGETFMLDCRTQCSCQNGRYACASLCPKENISPLGDSCRHPRLVEVPGQCCREWMCDSGYAPRPPECLTESSSWTSCSSGCGAGLSRRVSNSNPDCTSRNETRLCQLRPCPGPLPPHPQQLSPTHHIRRGHECKATQRLGTPVRLRFASCVSRKRYRPRWCGACGGSCGPELSTSLAVAVLCRQPEDTVEDATLGQDLWSAEAPVPSAARGYSHSLTLPVQWIVKCRCTKPLTTSLPELVLHRVHRTAAPGP